MRKLNEENIKQIKKILEEKYGIEDFDFDNFILLSNKEGKIFILSKDFEKILDKIKFNNIGLYVLKIERDDIRFSIEGSQIFGPLAKNRIVELDLSKIFYISEEMKKERINKENGFYIVKYFNDFGGSILVKNNELKDYIPKNRKIFVAKDNN